MERIFYTKIVIEDKTNNRWKKDEKFAFTVEVDKVSSGLRLHT